jgi:YbgC/YbaW family acyl-CoA thioester hydrolase
MSELEKELESTAFISFGDCDPFRHLNNARYVDYFLTAREQQLLANYNFSLAEWGARGKGWFVSQNQIAYLKPARYAETVIMISRLLEFTDYDLLLEMIMWDKKRANIKAIFWSRLSHIDLIEGKKLQHDDELKKLFSAVCYTEPEIELKSFDRRVEEIRNVVKV